MRTKMIVAWLSLSVTGGCALVAPLDDHVSQDWVTQDAARDELLPDAAAPDSDSKEDSATARDVTTPDTGLPSGSCQRTDCSPLAGNTGSILCGSQLCSCPLGCRLTSLDASPAIDCRSETSGTKLELFECDSFSNGMLGCRYVPFDAGGKAYFCCF